MRRMRNSLLPVSLLFATITVPLLSAQGTLQRVPPGTHRTPDDRPAARALKQMGKVEVISDSFGVDLDFYLRSGVLPYLRGAWHDYTAVGMSKPIDQRGEVTIDFDIVKDGRVTNIAIASPSGDPDIDNDAVEAIKKSSPYLALPSEFPGQYLRLRCQFFYNPGRFIHPQIVGANHDPARTVASAENNSQTVPPGPNGTTLPRAIYSPSPEYTDRARKAKVNAVILLKLTITTSGDVSDVKVVRGTGYGLDESAVKTVRTWRFKPATKDGVPVQTEVPVDVSFRLY